jgi:hypothetical protein
VILLGVGTVETYLWADATGFGLTAENATNIRFLRGFCPAPTMDTHSADVGPDGLGLALEGASKGAVIACFRLEGAHIAAFYGNFIGFASRTHFVYVYNIYVYVYVYTYSYIHVTA